ncbi:hypothetical protein T8K17_04305 [Thalassobaculum sp. OXR-137]|uniref:hypothetical protein n=1 Tax=Thalassobaculum sp. OXR-137 TaxID=3100173 RepID=UPI002AC9CCB6|nr:hypothetical protein [Thalassobaculum sp. OXR-137]WPZ35370.1 hypothetical protein T8K17_04305 [Thalassobaculum sp. OXR-137]
MPPTDDSAGGGNGPGASGPHGLDAYVDVAEPPASRRAGPDAGARLPSAATSYPGGDMMRGHGLPVGLTVPSIQLAHALELLNRLPRAYAQGRRPPAWDNAPFDAGPPYRDRAATRGGYEDADADGDAEEARRLVADALASLAGSAGLSVPMSALSQKPVCNEVDPEVEAAFVELDLAREAWSRLPAEADSQAPHPDVDRYFAAEEAVLSLADGSTEVLGRQAGLLLELTDEIADQMGPAAANAIANIAQGLLLRLRG